MKKTTLSSTKLTFELTTEAKETLEKLKSNLDLPFSKIINKIITTFCNIDDEIKDELLDMLHAKERILIKALDRTNTEFEIKSITDKIEKYQEIETLINNGVTTKINELREIVPMRKINLKNGYIIFPENWIVLNENKAQNYKYACVVEISRTSTITPHFLYFTNLTPQEYDDEFLSSVNELCTSYYPKFKNFVEQQIELVPDPEHPGKNLNSEEWFNAPIIGHFGVFIKGTPVAYPNYKPPYGAMIIQTEKGDTNESF